MLERLRSDMTGCIEFRWFSMPSAWRPPRKCGLAPDGSTKSLHRHRYRDVLPDRLVHDSYGSVAIVAVCYRPRPTRYRMSWRPARRMQFSGLPRAVLVRLMRWALWTIRSKIASA